MPLGETRLPCRPPFVVPPYPYGTSTPAEVREACRTPRCLRNSGHCFETPARGSSGASKGGNDNCGLETYQRDRFSPSTPALRCGFTPEDQRRCYDSPEPSESGLRYGLQQEYASAAKPRPYKLLRPGRSTFARIRIRSVPAGGVSRNTRIAVAAQRGRFRAQSTLAGCTSGWGEVVAGGVTLQPRGSMLRLRAHVRSGPR
jgi:hypothetical protein